MIIKYKNDLMPDPNPNCPICRHEMENDILDGIFCLGQDFVKGEERIYHKLYCWFNGDLISNIYISYDISPVKTREISLDFKNRKTKMKYHCLGKKLLQIEINKLLELDFAKLSNFKKQVEKYLKWSMYY